MNTFTQAIRKSSRRAVSIAVGIVLILVIGFLSVRNHRKFESAVIAQTHNQLLTTARSLSASIRESTKLLTSTLYIISEDRDIQRALKRWVPSETNFRSPLLRSLYDSHYHHADALYILDAQGRVVQRYPQSRGYPTGPGSLADRPDVAHVLDLKLPHISDPFRSRSGDFVFTTSVPIFDRSGTGEFVGIARWLIRISTIAGNFVSGVRVGSSGYVELVDSTGVLLATPDAEQIGRPYLEKSRKRLPVHDWSPLARVIAAMAGGGEGTAVADMLCLLDDAHKDEMTRKLIAYTPISFDNHTWSVLMSIDYQEVSAPITQSARENALFFCGILGAIALAGRRHLRVQKQLAVQQGERQLTTFLETMPIGIIVITPAGKVFYANPAAARVLGTAHREGPEVDTLSLFTDTFEAGTGKRYPRGRMPLLRALAGERASASDMELRKDDRVIPIELHGYPIHGEDGKLLFAVGAFQDITERRKAEQAISSAQQRLALHAQQTPLGVLEWSPDRSLVEWNRAAERLFGYTREEALHRPGAFLVPERETARFDGIWREILSSPTGHRCTLDHVTKDGREITCEWYSTPLIDGTGAVIGAASLVQDITERLRMEQSIIEARQDWEDTFSLISDSITVHDNQYNIIASNRAAQEVLGLSAEATAPRKCFRHYHGAAHPPTDCPSCRCMDADKEIVSEMFEPHLNRFIEIRAIPRVDRAGVRKGVIHVVRDISDRKRLEEELRQRAFYDSLTRLPNRMLFLDRLRNLFAHQQRQKDLLFAVLFIDLDHFKKINDTAGHSAGDALLVAVADRLTHSTRPGDTISRFGGDEFLAIVDGLKSVDDALLAADRISRCFTAPFSVDGSDVYITASIGIALNRTDCSGPDDLVRNADLAMYRAKEQGRSTYVLYDTTMHGDALESLKTENELRTAVRRGAFVIHYQPVIDIATGETYGFEALVRWPHPTEGLLAPGRFIPIAEETGMIVPLGEWVIRNACSQIKEWRDQHPEHRNLFVSVNVSAKQFNDKLPDSIGEILAETGLAPAGLRIEITESLLVEHASLAHEVLTRLRAMGIAIYLDDFGTGYSSLNYLHKFPINALKIDRTFVMNIVRDRQAQEIIRAIAMLANSLRLLIIVEGVEEKEQLQFFRELRCNLIQGFLFSRAVEREAAEAFISSRIANIP